MFVYECPNCGASLSTTEDPELMVCEYCGGRFSVASLRPASMQSYAEEPVLPPQPPKASAPSKKTPRHSSQYDVCRYLLGAMGVLFLLLVSCNYG